MGKSVLFHPISEEELYEIPLTLNLHVYAVELVTHVLSIISSTTPSGARHAVPERTRGARQAVH